jgi:TPP-dependent indolepyruvate ferredoxin oxidoreductase alpha subunit
VEEKRGAVEIQIKEALYHMAVGGRATVTGKTDGHGRSLLPISRSLIVMDRMKAIGVSARASLPSSIAEMCEVVISSRFALEAVLNRQAPLLATAVQRKQR